MISFFFSFHHTNKNSFLFKTWEVSSQNCKRVILQSSSNEYKSVQKKFDETMCGKYSQIIKIERIQNERWYKQVKEISVFT